MPICPNCGSYYVRPPCPACADISTEPSSNVVPASARAQQPQIEEKFSTVEKEIIDEITPESDSKDQIIENLERQLAEKQFEIDFLTKALKSIKQEVDKQIKNLKD